MFLDRIIETKKEEVAKLKARVSFEALYQQAREAAPALAFEKALTTDRNRQMGLIAEVKKASPSKGLIRPDFDPVAAAISYVEAKTDCISVLTDVTYFQGSDEYLKQIREAVSVPLLRKDFTIDPLQIVEARTLGADAVLLIAAVLETEQLRECKQLAEELGMTALIEVHNQEELYRTLEVGATLIGINNRNLHTFETDLATTGELAAEIPAGITIISESGISQPEQLVELKQLGAHGVLVGEHFMRQPSPGEAVKQLMQRVTNG